MPAEYQANKSPPHHEAPSPENEEKSTKGELEDDIPPIQEEDKGIGYQVFGIILVTLESSKLEIAVEDPSEVGPPESLAGIMRIQLPVGMGMVDPMAGDPGNRTSLDSQGSAHDQEALKPSRPNEASMGQKPMETQCNPQTAGHPPHHRA